MVYIVLEDPPDGSGYEPYGSAKLFWKCKDHEVMLSGPAETGKTRVCLEKLDGLMWAFPGARALMVRKTRKSMTGSVLQTYERKVLPADSPVVKYGGEHAEWYDYPNKSRISVGGMDVADKVLSSEYDVIYVNQSEELTLDDWEKLSTRCTGRAGNMPYSVLMGDCNPSGSTHWILARAKAGTIKMIESRHEDNPTLYDQITGEITEQGIRTMEILDSLTGVRFHRLRHGRWVSAEGVIYEGFDRAVHIIDPVEIPTGWSRIRAIDFGYTNPFVCQWWAIDKDGRMYLYRELYKTQLLVEDAAPIIIQLSEGEPIDATVCDHDAEDRATLEKHGILTVPAWKPVRTGIELVQARFRKFRDGRPRIFLCRDALIEPDRKLVERRKPTCLEEELESYVWATSREGSADKEMPNPVDDHGCDCMRYAAAWVERRDTAGVGISMR